MKEHAKKALKHDFKVAGKTVPTLALVALFLVGTGSAALLSTFGTVSGTADVEQSVTVEGPDSVSYDATMTAGATKIDTFNVTNDADVSAPVDFSTTCEATNTEDISDSNLQDGDFDCDGVTSNAVAYYDDAGHNFSNYEPGYSQGGDDVVYVDGSGSASAIQDAIDDSDTASGDVILVADGSYDPFTVDEDVTVVAENQGGATITGGDIGISITASGATVRGFEVQAAAGDDGEPNSRGIDVLASDVTVKSNYIHSVSDEERPIGIHLWGNGQDVSNTKVVNNRVEDVEATTLTPNLDDSDRDISKAKGIAVSGGGSENADDVEISHNTVKDVGNKDTALASAINIYAGAENFDVSSNVVGSVDHKVATDSPYDLGVYVSGYSSGTDDYGSDAVVTGNNFVSTDSDQLDVTSLSGVNTLNASDNWFGTNGIQTGPAVNASYEEVTSETLSAGETDTVGIYTNFDVALAPGDYEVDFDVRPQSATP
jgi:hypothetical protein